MTITRLPSHPLACQPGNECTVIRVRFVRLLFIGTLTRTDWQSHDMSCVFLWNVLCIFMECFCVTLGVHAHINLRLHFWTSPQKKYLTHNTSLRCVAFTTSNGHKYITYNGNFFTHGRCSADYICLCRRDRNTRPPKTIVITTSPKKVSFLVPVTAGWRTWTILIPRYSNTFEIILSCIYI